MTNGDGQKNHRLLIVSNRLPVNIEQDGGEFIYQPSVGGLSTSLKAVQENMEMLWLGWPGIDPEGQMDQSDIGRILKEEHTCIPLFPPKNTFDLYYYGFSNGCIWPLFHYFPQNAHYEHDEWDAYRAVNQIFCEKILEIVQPQDRIWIHDYHLMLLPAMVRERLPDIKIGFFLHIPFPSYEVFRSMPWREEILQGVLGADLIGFHSYGYTRHFLSSVLRLLGLEHEFGRVAVGKRISKADTFPLGIDVNRFSAPAEHQTIHSEFVELENKVENRKVVLSVDRLDFTKGIPERLLAIERFLELHQEWLGKVNFISLCVPSRIQVSEYQSLKQQVDELVGRINGRFSQPGWTPIWYLYRSMPFEKLLPLYQIADVALVTPLRDGMNLVAKEYLASKPYETGVLILSETAGAARELGEALIINPHDQNAIVEAIGQALNMEPEEQKKRNQPMLDRLRRYDVARWADDFITHLEESGKYVMTPPRRDLNGKWKKQLLEKYRKSDKRLLLLDYDGTLVSIVNEPDDAYPDESLLNLLKALSGDRRNKVYIISGRKYDTLTSWVGDLKIGLISEHGAKTLTPTSGEDDQSEVFSPMEWKDDIRPILEVYVDRTPGSQLEEKQHSLGWHYRRTEPEMGSLRAKELMNELEGFVANTPLTILHGKKIIEIRHSTISKGNAVRSLLSEDHDYSFILAAGDDTTDEEMFAAIPEHSWSIRLGESDQTHAKYFLPSPSNLRELLEQLVKTSIDDNR
jgi:trehalose 6-phosphate synthase/phosphatase